MAEPFTSQPLDTLHGGAHSCLVYRGRSERVDALARTVERARECGQRVLWIGCEPEMVPQRNPGVGALGGRGHRTGIERADERVAPFIVASTDGMPDRPALIRLLREETGQALEDGYSGLQAIHEMNGWIAAMSDMVAVKRYEADLSTFLPGSCCSVLCLYDRKSCAADQLLDLLELHTHVFLDGEPRENIYAIAPQDLLELNVPEATLDRRLRRLREHRDAEETRRTHTRMVELLHDVVWAGHQASSVEGVIEIVLERMCGHLGRPLAHAFRFDHATRELVSTGIWHGEDDEGFRTFRSMTEAIRFPLGVGLPGRAAAAGEPVWMSDVRDHPGILRRRGGTGMGVRSGFAVPIVSSGKLHSVFEFFSPVPEDADPGILEVLKAVGSQLSQVLERKEAENDLRLLETAVSHLEEAILILSSDAFEPDGPEIVYANPALEEITGYGRTEVVGQGTGTLFGSKSNDIIRRRAERCLSEGESVSGELVTHRKDDSEFVLQYSVSPVEAQDGRVRHLVAVFRDVTDERRAEEAIRRADHDSLTGLPNRDLFMRRLERSLERAQKRPDEGFAVLFMDLDSFKEVNDSLGHLRGDQLLVSLARRLEHTVRPGDTLARFGGDEFVILVDRVSAMEDVTSVANRIEEELEMPFAVGGRSLYISASIGIALSDMGDAAPGDLLRDADVAMYRAKSRGGATYEVFDRSLSDGAVSVLRPESDRPRRAPRSESSPGPAPSSGAGREGGSARAHRTLEP